MQRQSDVRPVFEAPHLRSVNFKVEIFDGDVFQLEDVRVERHPEVVFRQRRDDVTLERLEGKVGRFFFQEKFSEQSFPVLFNIAVAAVVDTSERRSHSKTFCLITQTINCRAGALV